MFFQLKGVTDAEGTGSPWFALSRESHLGFSETLSMLLAAKMAGKQIHVTASAQTVCGHAQVQVIQVP